jgi:peptide/nickel transport system substrate-binding protein
MLRKLRWPLLIVLLALVAIGFLLTSQQPILKPVEPVVEPATGGVYAEGLIGFMLRLNPILDYYNDVDRDVDHLLFSGLVRFDDRGYPVGDLTDSWGISQDGKVYNFSIRQNANWHDGSPVTSDDVIFTIDRMREDGSPIPEDLRAFWKQVEVKRLDDKTLQFRLPEAFAPFLDYLTFRILPEHLLGDLSLSQIIDSPFNLQPVGSGPYRFNQLVVEDGKIAGLVLSANKDYYGKVPFIEQIVFRYYPDAQTALNAYKQGEIQGINTIPQEILAQALQIPELNIHTSQIPELSMVFLNQNNPQVEFLKDAQVRRALMLGLNRQWMIDRILGSQAVVADGPIFPSTWAYYDGNEHLDYDPEGAVEILKQAGYTLPAAGGSVRENASGQKLSLELAYPDEPTYQSLAEAISKDWGKLGVEVLLKPQPYDELIANLDQRTYQSALVNLYPSRTPDPDPYPFWHQSQISGGQNYSQWDDRQASEFLEQARITVDLSERARLYRNFQVRFGQELPSLPLFYSVYRYGINEAIQGVRIGSLFDSSDRFATINDWYLVTKRTTGLETTAPATQTPIP